MSENSTKPLNLQQKKYIQKHKEDPDFTGYQAKISAILGSPVEIEFDWETVGTALATDSYQNMYLNNGNNIKEWFLLNFENGMNAFCTDSMSKDAFKEKIRKVKFIHHSEAALKIENSQLIYCANLHGGGSPGKDMIVEFLNENL